MATSTGSWEGFRNFKYQDAKYLFTFTSFDGSKFSQYITDVFSNTVSTIGAKAKTLPLYKNILTWACYTNYYYQNSKKSKESSVTTLEFSGDVAHIFNKDDFIGLMAKGSDTCYPETLRYNRETAVYSYGWTLEDTNDVYNFSGADNPCNTVISNPESLGFKKQYGGEFSLQLDLHALLTAASLNLGIILPDDLEKTKLKDPTGYTSYFDQRYPGMKPLYCNYKLVSSEDAGGGNIYSDDFYSDDQSINSTSITALADQRSVGVDTGIRDYCFAEIGNQRCIPALVPFDSDCLDCTHTSSQCNTFDLVPICLFTPDDATLSKVLAANDTTLYKDMQKYAVAILQGETADMSTFCGPSCSMLILNTYDDKNILNGYYHQNNSIHCADSFSVPSIQWRKLIASPPVPLTEPYYECYQKPEQILTNNFGIASSNAVTIGGPGIALAVIGILFVLSNCGWVTLPEAMQKELSMKGMLDNALNDATEKARESLSDAVA